MYIIRQGLCAQGGQERKTPDDSYCQEGVKIEEGNIVLEPCLNPINHATQRAFFPSATGRFSGDKKGIVTKNVRGAPERYVFPTLSFGLNTLTSMERKTSSVRSRPGFSMFYGS